MVSGSALERVWEHGQLVWGEPVLTTTTPETLSYGNVAGVVVDVGGVIGWTVDWLHPTRFRGAGGYANPSVELSEAPYSLSFDSLVERAPGEADEFSGTTSFVEQVVLLILLGRPANYNLESDVVWVVGSYLCPLPAQRMAQQHYEDFVVHYVTPGPGIGDVDVLVHRYFQRFYEWYLVRRWRILIACNGADALSFVDIDVDMALVRQHYDRQYDWLWWAVRRHVQEQRMAADDFTVFLTSTMPPMDADDDERWLR